MRFGSVCSGIEAASVAFKPLGWECQFVSEIDPSACFVLAHHYSAGRPRYMPSPDEAGIKPKDRRARSAALKSIQSIPEQTNGVVNFGDFTKIKEGEHEPIDLLIGGTPCQSFSIAGLRGGMADARGNLALEFIRLAQRSRARWVVWENVPGVFSSSGGSDFQSFLSGLVGWAVPIPGGGWRNSGVINSAPDGQSYGVAWRVLDAQYIRVDGYLRAVPQRRRRVVVVGYIGDWRRAASVLFERAGLRGDSPPRRETGQRVAPTISARTQGGGGLGTDFDCDGGLVVKPAVADGGVAPVSCSLLAKANDSFDDTLQTYVPEIVAQAMSSKWSKGSSGPAGDEHHHLVAHALRGDGFDASEDGTGRGTPIVPVVAFMPARTLAPDGQVDSRFAERDVCDAVHTGSGEGNKAPIIAFDCKAGANTGFAIGDVPGALRGEGNGGGHAAIAFSCKDYGADAGDVSPTLRAMEFSDSHANAGGQVAIAIQERAVSENAGNGPDGVGIRTDGAAYTMEARTVPQAVAVDMRGREGGAQFEGPHDTANTRASNGGSSRSYVAQTWRVRRLIPEECEALQGFPRGYTHVPARRGRLAADGPRYKQLGNSFACNTFRWVGRRIAMVESLS